MIPCPAHWVARRLEGQSANLRFGWTMATTKQRLGAEIGGWEAMANHHSGRFLNWEIASRAKAIV